MHLWKEYYDTSLTEKKHVVQRTITSLTETVKVENIRMELLIKV